MLDGSLAYAIAEMAGLKQGLGKELKLAPGFYILIAASTLIGIVPGLVCINPIMAFYYTAASNGLSAPLLMALIIMIANRRVLWKDSPNRE